VLTIILWPVVPFITGFIVMVSCSQASLEANTCGFFNFVSKVGALNQWAVVIVIAMFLISYMYELRNAKISLDDSNEYDEQLAALRLGEHVFNEAESGDLKLNDDEFEMNEHD
jgi:cell division protein FtsL